MKIAHVFLVLILIFVKKSTSQGVCVTVKVNEEEMYEKCDCDASNIDVNVTTFDPKDKPEQCGKAYTTGVCVTVKANEEKTYEKCDCDASNIDVNVKTFDPKDEPEQCGKGKPKSCKDVKMSDAKIKTKTGGVFDIYDVSTVKYVEVSCDLNTDGGEWTVFQRRTDGSENFYRGWDDYVNGFGRKDKEFWLGLEKLHQMTKNGNYELRVDLGAFDGSTAYAKYKSFSIGSSAENYRLNVGTYSGTAGDNLHNGKQFTTRDDDNDEWVNGNCAVALKGAWWHRGCGYASLNGWYHNTVGSRANGVWWWDWKGYEYLKFTEMKFRLVE